MTTKKEARPRLKIEGGHETADRISLPAASLNRALDGGLLLRAPIEIYGWQGSGKSSLALALAGWTAAALNKNGIVVIGDFEPFDRDFAEAALLHAGLRGTLRFVASLDAKKKPRSDEERLDDLVDALEDENVITTILDSVGAVTPLAEVAGSVGDAIMGVRAREMAKYMRGILRWMRNRSSPANAILVNHQHAIIGAGRGTTTVGGSTIKYLTHIQIKLSRGESFDDGSFVAEGRVDKLKYKKPPSERSGDNTFRVFILPGFGVHTGLTAVADCLAYKIAKKDRTVTLGQKSFGYMTKLIQGYSDDDLYKPFIKALEKIT